MSRKGKRKKPKASPQTGLVLRRPEGLTVVRPSTLAKANYVSGAFGPRPQQIIVVGAMAKPKKKTKRKMTAKQLKYFGGGRKKRKKSASSSSSSSSSKRRKKAAKKSSMSTGERRARIQLLKAKGYRVKTLRLPGGAELVLKSKKPFVCSKAFCS